MTVTLVLLAWLHAALLVGVFVALGRVLDSGAWDFGFVEFAGLGSGPETAVLTDQGDQGDGSRSAGIVAMIVCGVGAAACSYVEARLVARAQDTAERRLRGAVLLSHLSQKTARTSRDARVIPLATSSVERAAHYRAGFLAPTIGSFTTPLVVVLLLGVLVDWVVAGWLALMIVLVPLVIGVGQRLLSGAGGENRRQRAALSGLFLRSVQGLSTLVAFRAAGRAEGELKQLGEKQRQGLMTLLAKNQRLVLVLDLSVTLGLLVVTTAVSAAGVQAGRMGVGAALAAILIAVLAGQPADSVGKFFYIGIGGRAAEAALTRYLNSAGAGATANVGGGTGGTAATVAGATAAAATEAHHTASGTTPAILLSGVTAGWDPARAVIRDLDLTVQRGEHVALVGPSGVGKSTVAALIRADLQPSKGEVRVLGESTAGTSAQAIRERLAVVDQRTYLFQDSIAANLRLADANADEDRLWWALEAAGLAREVRDMPSGLATQVGEHGLTLSGGQAQRLGLARAFLKDAPVLVLDEPTSQVDLAGEAAYLAALERLCRDKAVLMIAHRPGAIMAADRVVTLGASS
ncbi:MAG: ATP-binding cassette domain-containing protein [Galactobacter sp.]|uniref:ATP-binding cassette domain-containing protein n=1 Tax=Galactobacter sp. TaxID=2676125 RepID=UPI0025C07D88|nr:ATP-binding cassette domain-containing protein [Galactobacter sp.]